MDRLIRIGILDFSKYTQLDWQAARHLFFAGLRKHNYTMARLTGSVLRVHNVKPSGDTVMQLLASESENLYVEPLAWLDEGAYYDGPFYASPADTVNESDNCKEHYNG
jgi:hypothetical protein